MTEHTHNWESPYAASLKAARCECTAVAYKCGMCGDWVRLKIGDSIKVFCAECLKMKETQPVLYAWVEKVARYQAELVIETISVSFSGGNR